MASSTVCSNIAKDWELELIHLHRTSLGAEVLGGEDN
jgi:hypothetical protein